MSLGTWLRSARSRHWTWPGRLPSLQTWRRPVRPVRLQVEWLEPRMLLSSGPGILGLPLPIFPFVDYWMNPNGGDWNNPANWSLGVPSSSSYVLIDLPGINFTVTHSTWKIGSFFSLTLGSTATLQLNGGWLLGSAFNNSGNFILGPGTSAYFGTLNNSGSLDIQGGPLSVTNLTQAGTFILGAGGSASVSNTLTNTGTVDVQGGTLTASNFAQGGSFTLEAGSNAKISAMDNTGTVNVLGGAILSATNYLQNTGATNLFNGSLDSTNAVQIQGGTLTGPGTINADLQNAGEISAGGPGTLIVNGNYTQATTGILDIGLGGTTAGVNFDQVLMSGAASLDGVLNVIYLNNFAPSAGQSFQVMHFSSSSGAFAAINGLNAANGTTLSAQYNPQDVTLVAQPLVPINPLPPVPPILPPIVPPPPVVSNPPPAKQPPTNTDSPTFLPPNSQASSGFSTQNQTHYYSGAPQGSAPAGGFSELSSSKHSEDVAFLGRTGDDDPEAMLDIPVQLNLTSDDEIFSASDIAAALLIGVRPKLLPQKGSQVAPVATLLNEDPGGEMKPIAATDEENPLKDFFINPLSQFHAPGTFQSSLRNKVSEETGTMGFDKIEPKAAQPPKSFPTLSSLIVLAGALVALWGIQKYRKGKTKPTRPGLQT